MFCYSKCSTSRISIIDSKLCTFCSEHPETLNNLLLNSKFFEKKLGKREDWVSEKLRVNIVLNDVHKLFGFKEKYVGFQFSNN